LATIGSPGNVAAGNATTELINHFSPGLVVLIGIACGLRGKTKLGQVIIAERIVHYEPHAKTTDNDGATKEEDRPETYRLGHRLKQEIVHYSPPIDRLSENLQAVGQNFPDTDGTNDFASSLQFSVGTIASGEILWRNPDEFKNLRTSIHGKIECADMEGFGVVEACERARVPWLVVRGISDFGDAVKVDDFHTIAATAASIIAIDFLEHDYEPEFNKSSKPLQSESVATAHARVPAGSKDLRLPKTVTEFDRTQFAEDAYELIAQEFESLLSELQIQNETIQTKFKRVDANCFTASIFLEGEEIASCRIRLEKREIKYSNQANAWANSDNSYNECLNVSSDPNQLHLEGLGMPMSNRQDVSNLSPAEAADYYWSLFTERLFSRI